MGDGVMARQHFTAAAEQARTSAVPTSMVRQFHANSCENMMLLSLSYDEYEQWAAELETVEPTNDILRGQRPRIRSFRDEGQPWSFVMLVIAQTYYDRGDQTKDRGRYACGLATFRVMVTHR